MKESLSSLDIAAVTAELRGIVGGHLDKVYHPDHGHLVFTVRSADEGRSYVHVRVGKWVYRTPEPQEMPQQPSDFAMMLRKRISNAKIVEVRQQGFERIIVIGLEKDGRHDLVLELFAEGNVILVKDGVIIQPLTSKAWKHRDVRARKEYVFPPPIPDTASMVPDDLLALLRLSGSDLVRTLATKLNLGGRYSEEVCARTDLGKDKKAAEITTDEASRILETIANMRMEAGRGGTGHVFLKDGVPEDVSPMILQTHSALTVEDFASFSAAVESYVHRMPVRKAERPADAERTKELERLKRKVAQQEAAIIRLQDEGREAQTSGDSLFAIYTEVSRILSIAQRLLADGKEMSGIPGFVSYNPKNALLKVKVGPVDLVLDAKGTVESSAQRYYEEAKRARRKLEGVLPALDDARKAVAAFEKEQASLARKEETKRKPTKRFWFERFRWFVSSEGAVVLGGKDAKSNDMLVKKHLDAGDRYAHADIHGAPSVVVKMKEGVTELTLREACEFAVATSRAWNARIGSAAGYWVLPEQVSKTPQSGEFLAKGAFVIRGKRNYADKVDIIYAVGEIQHERNAKVMGGPVGAVKASSKRYVVLRPGDIDRNLVSKQLAEIFGVPIDEVQSVMPPGDVTVVEQVGLSLRLPSP